MPQARALGKGVRANTAAPRLLPRLVPLVPGFRASLVPAFVGVRPPVVVATHARGILPGTAVSGLAGAGLGEVLTAGGECDAGAARTPPLPGALFGPAALPRAALPLQARFARHRRRMP